MNTNVIKKILITVFVVLILLSVFIPLNASAADSAGKIKTVKVGCFECPGFQDSSYSGYNYDYLQSISHYNGWKYKFVSGTYAECEKMLKDGTIDIMGGVKKASENASLFSFSSVEEGSASTCLFVSKNNTKYTYDDYSSFDGMTVAVMKGDPCINDLNALKKTHGFKTENKYYDTYAEVESAVKSYKADAGLTNSFCKTTGCRTIAKSKQSSIYFAAAKGSTDLMNELDSALSESNLVDPYFASDLYKEHYSDSSTNISTLTKEEKKYVKEHPTLTLAYDPSWAPIEYTDPETGRYSGIMSGVFDRISDETGLKFKFICGSSFNSSAQLYLEGKAQGITSLNKGFGWAQAYQCKNSQTILACPVVQITHPDAKTIKTIALPKGYFTSWRIKTTRKDLNIKYYDSTEECMKALSKGKADATYANTYVADYYMNQPPYSKFLSTNYRDLSEEICIAINNEEDPLLLSILDKGIHSISSDDMQSMISKATVTDDSNVLSHLLYLHPIGSILLVIAVLGVIILLLILILISHNRHTKVINDMLYTDNVLDHYSYERFLTVASEELETHQDTKHCLLYMDILKFKYINDIHGYEEGDKLLRAISRGIEEHLTSGEYYAREYADRFVILFRYSDFDDNEKRLDTMLDDLTSMIHNETNYNSVFHGGLYIFEPGETDIPQALDMANYAKSTLVDSLITEYSYYDSTLRSMIINEREMENSMQNALETGQFKLYLQGQINIKTGKLIGAEGLVRWEHPERGLLLPSEFVPFFEKTGFIVEVDYYIFEEACKFIRNAIDSGRTPVRISTNFSRLHLNNPDFTANLTAIAEKYDVPKDLLELELTETIAVEDMLILKTTCDKIRAAGFRIAIDDFGSGYSSINLLQNINIDMLKLDRSFILSGLAGSREELIMSNVIRTAQ
ncbi:MAG: EAL domain-containing protein [Eubacteriaceae bacterium]|nr:EAL domain-containing protein [Eubacteriaceae bacterium]